MITLRALNPAAAERCHDQLSELLEDAVASGASVGFLLPLERTEVESYWRGVVASLREGRLQLLAAFEHERLVGSVQLWLEPRANGRHRAEITKLMVRRADRRLGIGRSLMQAARNLALRSGRTLLLLDVRTGDPAEALYSALGFVKFGEVPRYARSPGGGLAPSSFYYLELQPAT